VDKEYLEALLADDPRDAHDKIMAAIKAPAPTAEVTRSPEAVVEKTHGNGSTVFNGDGPAPLDREVIIDAVALAMGELRDEVQGEIDALRERVASLEARLARTEARLAEAETPAKFFTVRGTYSPAEKYRALDVVVRDNTWFVARRDDPGECPGPGWQAGPVGKRGEKGVPGERGPRGEQGAPGKAAPDLLGATVADYDLIFVTKDGETKPGPRVSLLPMFRKFASEMQLVEIGL
jgi:hypothetical protein